MKSPLAKEKPGATWTGATGQTDDSRAYSPAQGLQASLAQRLNEPASVSQLLPLVLTKTLTLGFHLWPTMQSVDPRTIKNKDAS